MERLEKMKDILVSCVEGQLGNLQQADTKELGEVVDMIKDLEEAMYYCAITDAMEEKEKEKQHYPMIYPYPYYRDMDMEYGRRYYSEDRRYRDRDRDYREEDRERDRDGRYRSEREDRPMERDYAVQMRDTREGRSPISRKMYMESKEMHKDKNVKLHDLEKYMQELSSDLVEMIEDASPEEQQFLEKRITSLAAKISQLNA